MGAEGGAHGLDEAIPVPQSGELDEADSSCRVVARWPFGGAYRVLGGQTCLPDASGTGQGNQTGTVETLPDLAHLTVPAHRPREVRASPS